MLGVCAQVAAIPVKRVAPPEAHFLDRDGVSALLRGVPSDDRHAARDRTLLLFLYNTGARAQEVAELRVRDPDLNPPPRVRRHGKGDKWRVCPLWTETARQLQELLRQRDPPPSPEDPVFVSRPRQPLTR